MSQEAFQQLRWLGYKPLCHEAHHTNPQSSEHRCYGDPERDDPRLVQTIQKLGSKAGSDGSHLQIIEVPDDVDWRIGTGEDGVEWVYEVHRIWGWPNDSPTFRRFLELRNRWTSETRHLSPTTRISQHPSAQEILEMGEEAIGFIYNDLQKEHRERLIDGSENPETAPWEIILPLLLPEAKPVRGIVKKMREHWRQWLLKSPYKY